RRLLGLGAGSAADRRRRLHAHADAYVDLRRDLRRGGEIAGDAHRLRAELLHQRRAAAAELHRGRRPRLDRAADELGLRVGLQQLRQADLEGLLDLRDARRVDHRLRVDLDVELGLGALRLHVALGARAGLALGRAVDVRRARAVAAAAALARALAL